MPCPAMELGADLPSASAARADWFMYRWPPAGVFELLSRAEDDAKVKSAGETPAVHKSRPNRPLCSMARGCLWRVRARHAVPLLAR